MIRFRHISWISFFLILMIVAAVVGFELAFKGLIYPKVTIAQIEVTGMAKDTALEVVKKRFELDPSLVSLSYKGKEVADLSNLQVKRDFNWASDQAFNVGRSGNLLTQYTEQYKSFKNGRNISIPLGFEDNDLNDLYEKVSDQIDKDPVWPTIAKEKNKLKVIEGKDGLKIKRDELIEKVKQALVSPGNHTIEIPVDTVNTKYDQQLIDKAFKNIYERNGVNLKIKTKDFEITLSEDEITKLFGIVNNELNLDNFENLVDKIKSSVEKEPKDAVFVFENNKVNEFKPEVIGTSLDIPKFREKLIETLNNPKTSEIELPLIFSYPKIKTGDINNMGIKELIATGKSSFSHSIPGRVFNVNLAASRINGALVAPNEEFSFNNAVGEISRSTGYQTAYVISGGKTVLGDGGGVCQVSTTVFRAALNFGFPITERKAHAYRVGYYEQDSSPGIDATIFSPTADFKFLNDTQNYILIQTTVDTKNLTMRVDIYGTNDGRKSTISKPVISSQTPPLPTSYVDDPTLPAGTTKQIDWAASGAKVSFDYKVEKDGVVFIEKTFYSNYQPWRAIILKGTGG